MSDRFADNGEAVRYMREVAVSRSGFSAWLGIEPVRCWEGEAELILETAWK